jgi:hypothetical protein
MGKKIIIDEDLLGTIVLRLQHDNENMQAKTVLNYKMIREINCVINKAEEKVQQMDDNMKKFRGRRDAAKKREVEKA